jgi:hypothetical protein
MNMRACLNLKAVLLLALGQFSLHAQSQVTSSPVASQPSDTSLQAFLSEQQSLMEARETLVANGATQAQLRAWEQQNASPFSAQNQLAASLSDTSQLQLSATTIQPNIPANASSTLVSFLTLQAALAQSHAQIHNNLVQSLSLSSTSDQINAALGGEGSAFQLLNSTNLTLVLQDSQTLAAQVAQTSLPLPQPPQFPADATPQMIAYQTQFYQLNLQRIQLWNQYTGASPDVRAAALQVWRAQNATALAQLQQQAQTLTQVISTSSN